MKGTETPRDLRVGTIEAEPQIPSVTGTDRESTNLATVASGTRAFTTGVLGKELQRFEPVLTNSYDATHWGVTRMRQGCADICPKWSRPG